MCSAAPSKGADEEDDLFTWEPKAKEDTVSNGAGAKRKKAAPKESKPRKKKKAQGLTISPIGSSIFPQTAH